VDQNIHQENAREREEGETTLIQNAVVAVEVREVEEDVGQANLQEGLVRV
jgi:hypothetical protein